MEVGGPIIFVDAYGRQHDALITAIWGNPDDKPCINVVYVSSDADRQDSFGRQIERHTSIVHKGSQPAHGMYYMEAGDTPNPVAKVLS